MNLKEYAEEKGISLSEAKELTGLTHWKQEVQEVVKIPSKQEIPEPAYVEPAYIKPVVIKTKSKATVEQARALRGMIGDKTKEFLVFVNDNKDAMPEEFERVKHNIEKYL